MNMGGLLATLILSGLILRLRSMRFRADGTTDRATRRGLGLVALVLPLAGLALPYIPWRNMGALMITGTVRSLSTATRWGPADDTDPQ